MEKNQLNEHNVRLLSILIERVKEALKQNRFETLNFRVFTKRGKIEKVSWTSEIEIEFPIDK